MTQQELKEYIIARIYPNNAQEITGASLQEVLLAIVANSQNEEEATEALARLATDIATKVSEEVFNSTVSAIYELLGQKASSEELATAILDIKTNAPIISGGGVASVKMNFANCFAEGNYASAIGLQCSAGGAHAHAEGWLTTASGETSHAEGDSTKATNRASHAEGRLTKAEGANSHAEGYYSEAQGTNSHAEGRNTVASGANSHAGGDHSVAEGGASFAHGSYTKTTKLYESAFGRYNESGEKTRFSIGNGKSDAERSNLFEVRTDNTAYIGGYRILTVEDYNALIARIEALEV